ncbi:hypothetical protein [uncultured Maribacter sp.]|uniref:hypothetical protein n=1 Tax=uncultured Maribacter sp. TaxID=431308 RepID=UPI0030DDB383|tara:strand:- start:3327 stop:3749 length:423 start_codon:yes stop_codon:yes gene_type:complete
MRKKLILLVVTLALINNGCSIEDDGANFHFTALEIVDAELPESFDYNQTYEILVNYIKPDSCTNYEGFDVVKDSLTIRNVVAIGSVRTDIDGCTLQSIEQTASFNFKVIYTDPYTFKFYTGENSEGEAQYFEVLVPVNKP